ncbi:GAF domain-containing protein [bacterium]|nr:GAF domain-containing protein [bacterium]
MKHENLIKKYFLYTVPILLGIGIYFGIKMNPHSLSWFIAAVINLSLAIFVYLKNKKSEINRTFALMSICLCLWAFLLFGTYIAPNEAFVTYWSKVFRVGMLFIPATFFHFILALTRNKDKRKIKLLYIAYAIALASTILHWMGLLTSGYINAGWKYSPKPGILYRLWLINLVFWLSYGLFHVFQSYRVTKFTHERNQLRYFLIGATICIVFGLVNVLTSFAVRVYPVGGFTTIIYTGIIAYAIVKHQLMDIRIIIGRSVAYASLTASIAGGYFIILWAFSLLFANVAGHNVLATIAFALIIVFGFQRLKDKVQYVVDRLFFKEKYDYHKTLREFSGALTSIVELDRLSNLIVNTVAGTMHIGRSSLLILDEGEKQFEVRVHKGLQGGEVGGDINLGFDSGLVKLLNRERRILNREEIEVRLSEDRSPKSNEERWKEYQEAKAQMDKLEAVISIPLMRKDRLIGVFNLGEKKSEDAFTAEDLELLTTISNNAAIAIENARLYEERRGMERQLYQSDKLAALGTLASEMAHEMKNPLVSIKTFAQLFPRRFRDESFRDKFSEIIPQELDRLENVLGELLNFARPSDVKFQPVDIAEIIDSILLLMGGEISKHQIRVYKQYYNHLPRPVANKEQLKQVFMNLILNAIHSMPEGGDLTISVKVAGESSKAMEINFRDTGCGIPGENLSNLFNPFFTTKEGGTGLGLAISQRIVKEHNGAIEVESQVGKGTTFTIKLPTES